MGVTPRPGSRRNKWLKLLLGVAVLGAIGAIVYLNLEKEEKVPTYASVWVKRGALVDKLAETGSLELVRTVEIKSTISGRIRELPAMAGDVVHEGQLLAVIEPDPNQSLQMMQKRSTVERATLNLEEQQRDLGRERFLRQRNMNTPKDLEDAEMRVTRARNELRLAQLELEVLLTKADPGRVGGSTDDGTMDDIRVLASIDGIIVNRGVEIGEVVASGLSAFSGGTVLFEIGDTSRMIVRADIAEIDIGKLRVDQEVAVVVDAYPDTTYGGRVRWIAPVGLKKQGSPIVTFDAEIDIRDHDPRLRQGMSCDIDIIFTRRDSTLYLPIETALEIFDTEDEEEEGEVKGRRGRFLAYVVHPAEPDSTAQDTLDAEAAVAAIADTASAGTDTTVATADTLGAMATAAADADTTSAPDTTVAAITDTARAGSDTTVAAGENTASAAADTTTVAGPDDDPPEAPLDDFVEVELLVGLETTTRIEILSGLEDGDRVAADPELIRRKLEEKAKGEEAEAAEEDEEEAEE